MRHHEGDRQSVGALHTAALRLGISPFRKEKTRVMLSSQAWRKETGQVNWFVTVSSTLLRASWEEGE